MAEPKPDASAAASGRIGLEIDAGVATITVDWPELRNALSPAMAASLVDACDTIDADDTVGAAVIRGAGATFCSGADRAALDSIGTDPAHPDQFVRTGSVYASFVRVGDLGVPTIAAAQGQYLQLRVTWV